MNSWHHSALAQGLLRCHDCTALWPLALEEQHCPRCGALLHSREPNSLVRTWALLITSALLMLPANLLPIMRVTMLSSQGDASTIMGGVIELTKHGLWGIAIVVLAASILIPVGKILALGSLLIAIQFGKATNLKQKMVMFRIVHWIGRWSMLDIFVVGILVALVQFGNLAYIVGQTGALAFAGVVVFTMLAANTLDTRLIWDRHLQEASIGSET
ncbi:paraquat-inducible protein A [Marinobacterium sp. D7]|uniref:paraquat-inducible protein A n=1 Tax=Marinobacterium ramblicola TaxID=2849041 RepID=UPI001C2DA0B9|nr:paraquat-inducible protein A [Marinobacterium ramblicola]MBV1789782.1 paraquat-inducible protein A [Marinobacterium ramblicola]